MVEDYKDRLNEAMRDASVSTTDLSRALGVSYQAVRKVQQGGQFGTDNNVKAAKVLGVSSDWLATGKGPKLAGQSDSGLEDAFAKIVEQRGLKVDRPTIDQVPRWLKYHDGRQYLPDFVLSSGDRRVFVEVRGHPEGERTAALMEMEREHPEQFAVFVPDYTAPQLGIDALLARIHMEDDSAFDMPAFSRGPGAKEPPAAYGMSPILAWEHQDDLPEGEFVMIPRLDVHLSAGNGHNNQVEIELTKENPQAFRTEWIRLMKLRPAKLAAMRASGESMEPTIHDGDSLLVDTSQTEVVDGKVYALWYDGGERVKRLFRHPGGGLRIESDNPRFPAMQLQASELENIRIIGRVVHRSGTGGL